VTDFYTFDYIAFVSCSHFCLYCIDAFEILSVMLSITSSRSNHTHTPPVKTVGHHRKQRIFAVPVTLILTVSLPDFELVYIRTLL